MARKPRPKAVLFDLYNTLIDIRTDEQDPEVWQNLARFLRYQGIVAEPVALRSSFLGAVHAMQRESEERYPEVDVPGAFSALLRGLGYVGPEQFSLQVAQLFRALTIRRFGLFPEVLPALEELRPAFRLGLISDSQRAFLDPEMQLLGLTPNFDVRILSYDHGFRKPDPRLFRMALAALDVAPSDAVYVGDHPYRDICGAQRVGMRAVLMRRSGAPVTDSRACAPDLLVRNLDELVAWLLDSSRWGKVDG